ncbi:MAG: beta-phosphoglucomutase [Lachnospiraceae bacterium]|nr:beta-phosphoglucomutase [Lachnospiraceae bacterium]
MRVKVIIFGLDGVICHTEKYHYLAWKEIADELGIPFTEEMNRRFIGMSRMDSLNELLKGYPGSLSRVEKEVLAEQKNDIFKSCLITMTERDVDPKLRMQLRQLKQEGYLLAIASSSKNAGIVIKNLGLDSYFDTISDGNSNKKLKPNPEVFLNICGYLQVKKEECLIVEGTSYGIRAAKKTGMHVAALHPEGEYTMEDMAGITVLDDLEQLKRHAAHIYK